ncbi:MAG: DUF1697 domain-containing protein [Gemmatimonadales bacterium]
MPRARSSVSRAYVAFLRAINVAGHASVRMEDLRRAFAAAGGRGVRTYIQSGNVMFEGPANGAPALFQRIRLQLRKLLGDDPEVVFRTVREVERIVKGAPFKRFARERDAKLYVTFLSRKPLGKPRFPLRSAQEVLEAFAMKNLEVFIVSRRKKSGFYGFPNSFIEHELGVSATSRNWSTVTKIVAFARQEAAGR